MNEDQKEALELFKKGKNMFITGPAGTGKSYIINMIHNWCNDNNINISITSTTGISAMLLEKGSTVHCWAGIGIGISTREKLIERIRKDRRCVERWCKTNVLIIDEISMLPIYIFEKLNYIGQKLRHDDNPFGGIQLILCGDFAQLPPIDSDFLFNSPLWKFVINDIICLKTNMRQSNIEFSHMLSELRLGIVSNETKQMLLDRMIKPTIKDFIPTELHSRRNIVDEININSLYDLIKNGEKLYQYLSYDEIVTKKDLDEDKKEYLDKLDNYCHSPKLIELCINSQVMLTSNINFNLGLCNGSRGIVIRIDEGFPVVKFLNGVEITIKGMIFQVKIDQTTYIKRYQLPLILAWALTIHKSQGSSLDYASIDIGSSIFSDGQVYVALSRLKTKEGLFITSFDENKITVNQKVKDYYDNIL